MDLAIKKIELINWLTLQNEGVIKKIDELRKSSIESALSIRMSESVTLKLKHSEADIKKEKVHSQKRWKLTLITNSIGEENRSNMDRKFA